MENPGFDFTEAIRGIPFDRKWDIFKPELEALFQSGQDYASIAHHMKAKYAFDAQISAYKYRFNKAWGWKKKIPVSKKEKILHLAHERAIAGKRTAAIFGNTPVDAKKLKRHVAATQDKALLLPSFEHASSAQQNVLGTYLPFGARPFSIWNVPLGGAMRSYTTQVAHSPQYTLLAGSPGGIVVKTPPTSQSLEMVSPALSCSDPPSPFSSVVARKFMNDRTSLFLQGRFSDVLKSMSDEQARTMSNWLYQFWFFGFITAKCWGLNLPQWNADTLHFETFDEKLQLYSAQSPNSALSPFSLPANLQSPSDLCNWSIHILAENQLYEPEETHQPEASLEQSLQDGLRSNTFSNIPLDEIPMRVSDITKAIETSTSVLSEESLAFAIMAQNFDLIEEILIHCSEAEKTLTRINAMHIATSYLNGAKMCCNILSLICSQLGTCIREAYTNSHGHTILDNLIFTILRSHSTTAIGRLDQSIKRGARYAGIEVDICGRWDADSPNFRALIASGLTAIPKIWKHKFCHTSVQAVCHSLQTMKYFGLEVGRYPSGVFQNLCTCCGVKLQLMPLHSLVMMGYILGVHALEGEDLFGVVACYVCLLSEGVSPQVTANISVAILLGQDEDGRCTHREMTPYELIRAIPEAATDSWSESLRAGWKLLSHVCERAQHMQFPNYEDECDDIDSITPYFKYCREEYCEDGFYMDSSLAHLWASIQAELLNYRRLHVGDPWLSANFNIDDLNARLDSGATLSTGHIEKELLHPYCEHGRFFVPDIPLREDVSEGYYSNMDCWARTSFIKLS